MDKIIKTPLFVCLSAIAIIAAFFVAPQKEPKLPENYSPTTGAFPVTGYYESYEKRREYDGVFYGTTTCDAFVEIRNDNVLVSDLKNTVRSGNTVNSISPEGNLRINIDIVNLNIELQNRIRSSMPRSPITLEMRARTNDDGKEAPPCYSFVEILDEK